MRKLIVILSFFTFNLFACEEGSVAEFRPFAEEIKNYPNLRSFMVYFPDNDMASTKMYLSAISASHEDKFTFDLEHSESAEYPGYYSALVSVEDSLVASIFITGSYNYGDKSGSKIAFCANWKNYRLKQLLENKNV